jgi:hypothetical protein
MEVEEEVEGVDNAVLAALARQARVLAAVGTPSARALTGTL